ncbi:MAG: type II secretion system protein, partial [Limisphaerales bacterium]
IRKAQQCGNWQFNESRHGFALIELLIVAAILVILMVMYYGRGSSHFQKAQQAACRQNLQTIHIALQTYANENRDRFPSDAFSKTPQEALAKLVPQYTTRTDAFTCPGRKEGPLPTAQPIKNRRISYAYLMGLTSKASPDQWIMADWLLDTKAHAKGELIFSSDGERPANNHDKFGGVLLLVDGSAEISKPTAKFAITTPKGTKILNPDR